MENSVAQNSPDDVCTSCGVAVSGGRDGCQRLFEEMLVRDYSDYRYARVHRLMVDAYSLQHPDKYMRSGKSFAAHLTGMYAAMEHDDNVAVNQSVQKWLNGPRAIEKPAHIPERRGELTILYVHGAADAEEHSRHVREWARSVWEAWAEHHELARRWIDEASKGE